MISTTFRVKKQRLRDIKEAIKPVSALRSTAHLLREGEHGDTVRPNVQLRGFNEYPSFIRADGAGGVQL